MSEETAKLVSFRKVSMVVVLLTAQTETHTRKNSGAKSARYKKERREKKKTKSEKIQSVGKKASSGASQKTLRQTPQPIFSGEPQGKGIPKKRMNPQEGERH